MKELPILFQGEMVTAIKEDRKSVTRRLVTGGQVPREDTKVPPGERQRWYAIGQRHSRYGFCVFGATEMECARELAEFGRSPYGKQGGHLWVRETYADIGCRFTYRADVDDGAHCMVKKWTPSIHMPRSACRLLLDISAVHVERLQDITEEQAITEGILRDGSGWRGGKDLPWCASPIGAFRILWESINGRGSWDANPWVWAIHFKRLTP